jgi:hypothetical protein
LAGNWHFAARLDSDSCCLVHNDIVTNNPMEVQ